MEQRLKMFERSFKVVLLGDYAVGKTCLLNRFLQGDFKVEYVPTVKANIHEKEFRFPNYVFRLFYWDTAGMYVLDESSAELLAGAHAVILVYDVSRSNSLAVAERQYEAVKGRCDSKPIIWLVGNKIDLKDRSVDRSKAEKMARELGFSYIETSAKTGENVSKLFNGVFRDLVKARLSEVKRKLEEG